jgi:hypothetical protein
VNIPPPGGEVLAAPGQKAPEISAWFIEEDWKSVPGGAPPVSPNSDRKIGLRYQTMPQHFVPRAAVRQVMQPQPWSVALAHSYSRYQARAHGAHSAELIRITRNPILPAPLFGGDLPPAAFDDLVASFGEVTP